MTEWFGDLQGEVDAALADPVRRARVEQCGRQIDHDQMSLARTHEVQGSGSYSSSTLPDANVRITINYDDHLPPHFHARYGEHRAAIEVGGAVLAGSLPRRALALARTWASLHRSELHEDWDLARRGRPLDPIAPLD